MKAKIELTKEEAEKAVKDYVLSRFGHMEQAPTVTLEAYWSVGEFSATVHFDPPEVGAE